ncbi:MAG TPA: hypothetical protein VKQ73_02050 [Stellaceae bacterium]|nr:hypothetical protein [Stellaceae bacterium]
MTKLPANIIDAMTAPDWWGPWFARGDWSPWRSFLRALFGLPMSEADLDLYCECTGRSDPPSGRAQEAFADVGRRGGKTRVMALVAAWLAAFEDWRGYLDPGENAHILIIAKDTTQATICHGYLASLLLHHPVLHDLVIGETADSLTLANRVIVRVAAASFRGLRGFAVAALLADELAYWFDGESSANPAEEILAAVRPGMLQFGGRGMLLAGSSPYRRTGPLWDAFRRHYGKPSPVLFWKAPTLMMNRLAPADEIARAYEEDPQKAAAEYGAEFRQDIAAFIDREAVEAVVAEGRFELPRVTGTAYTAFVDPSGGSQDAMTLGVSHRDKTGLAVLDCIREIRPPFSPEAVVAEFAEVLKDYGAHRVTGDHYAGEWPREQFRKHAIEYIASDKSKSAIYQEALPLLNSGKVELLDNARLISQICGLERRTARGGRDSIDHGPSAHDDIANAALGALVLAAGKRRPMKITPEVLARFSRPRPPRSLYSRADGRVYFG